MSRQLPAHPNLEHLKKQAKERLHALQERDPAFKLSDAQHALAKEYGFASWPKLKAYVESLPADTRSAAAPRQANPFVGTWVANLSKSRRHRANPFQSAMLQLDVVGDIATIADVVVDASGREEQGRNTFLADGREHPAERRNGYLVKARWHSSTVLEVVVKKEDHVEGRVTYEVSADGKTLTISTEEQVIVLDRQ